MDYTPPLKPGDHIHFERVNLVGPGIVKLLNVSDHTIVFDGYYRYEPELFCEERPIYALAHFRGHAYILAFTAKRIGEDTSVFFSDDEEGGRICLTPTEIIELDYRVVEKDPPKDTWIDYWKRIRDQDKEMCEMNEEFYRARRRREWEARMNDDDNDNA